MPRSRHSKRRADPDPELVLPRNLEAEKAVLGAILLHNEAIVEAIENVDAEDFYREPHRRIFSKMKVLAERGTAIDLVTLKAEFGSEIESIGGPSYITALVDGMPRSSNIRYHAQLVRERSRARRMILAARDAIATFSTDPAALSNGAGAAFATTVRDLVDAAHDETEEIELSESVDAFLATTQEPAPPLVKGLIPGAGIVLPHGQPRSRKTLVVMATFIAAAAGRPPFGVERLEVTEPIRSWFATEEDPSGEMKQRTTEIIAGLELSSQPTAFRLSVQRGLSLDDVQSQDRIIREIQKHQIQVLGLDPLRALSAAVDKGPGDLQPLVKALRRIMRETGVVLVLPHHDVKPRADGKPDDRPRAQRASGGGILSISEAPIHVERVSDDVTLLVPSFWKFSADPAPIKVRFERGPGWTRLIGEDVDAVAAESLAVHERVLAVLAGSPGLAGNAVAKQARLRREAVYQALDDLAAAGKVDSAKAGRAVRWFLKGVSQ